MIGIIGECSASDEQRLGYLGISTDCICCGDACHICVLFSNRCSSIPEHDEHQGELSSSEHHTAAAATSGGGDANVNTNHSNSNSDQQTLQHREHRGSSSAGSMPGQLLL